MSGTNKTNSPSIYLAQSYHDAWADYQRCLKSETFPVWDYVILTASNEHQAHSFEMQLESRREFIPSRTKFAVIPDEFSSSIAEATASVYRSIRPSGNYSARFLMCYQMEGQVPSLMSL